jgi:hypothetical protein
MLSLSAPVASVMAVSGKAGFYIYLYGNMGVESVVCTTYDGICQTRGDLVFAAWLDRVIIITSKPDPFCFVRFICHSKLIGDQCLTAETILSNHSVICVATVPSALYDTMKGYPYI